METKQSVLLFLFFFSMWICGQDQAVWIRTLEAVSLHLSLIPGCFLEELALCLQFTAFTSCETFAPSCEICLSPVWFGPFRPLACPPRPPRVVSRLLSPSFIKDLEGLKYLFLTPPITNMLMSLPWLSLGLCASTSISSPGSHSGRII